MNSTMLAHIKVDKKNASSFYRQDRNLYSFSNILQNVIKNAACLYLLRGDLLRLLGDRLRRRGERDLLLMGDRDLLLDGDHLLGGLTSFDLSRLDKISSLVRVLKIEEENGCKIRSKQKPKITLPSKSSL